MSFDSIATFVPSCPKGKCHFIGTEVEGACPGTISECFAFGEACRLRKKYWSLSNEEIASHVGLVVARGCSKKPPPPDNPEAYLRKISVNLEGQIVRGDIDTRAIHEAAFEEGDLAEYAKSMRENYSVEPTQAIEAREMVALFASTLSAELRKGHCVSTREFFHLSISCGLKPSDFVARYPEIKINEVKYHQSKIREAREALAPILNL